MSATNDITAGNSAVQYLKQLQCSEEISVQFHRHGPRYAWLAMAIVVVAMLATVLSGTVINVAIPHIMGSFGVDQDRVQWLATTYLAAATLAMLCSAWLIHAWGYRLVVTGAMTLFLVGSLTGALSNWLELMIAARIAQGLSAGLIAPLPLMLAFQLFPAGRQGTVMGLSSIGAILAPALGPTVGGLLIDSFDWRYVFYMGLPFSLLCIPLALVYLPARRRQPPPRFDWLGLTYLTAALTLLLTAIGNGERMGWSSDFIVIALLASILSAIAFIHRQLRANSPLLDLQLLRHRRFVIFALTAFIFGAGLFGSSYLIPIFLQLVQGMSATESGLTMMPAGLLMALVLPACGRLADRIDTAWLIVWAVVLFFLSFYLLSAADSNTSFWTFALWLCLGRLGLGLALPAMSMGAVKSVPDELVEQAAAVLSFMRQLGGAFGVNLLSMALSQRSHFHLDVIYQTQSYGNSATMDRIASTLQGLQRTGLSDLDRHTVALQHLGQSLYQQASVAAFRDSFLIASVFFLLTLLPLSLLIKNSSKK